MVDRVLRLQPVEDPGDAQANLKAYGEVLRAGHVVYDVSDQDYAEEKTVAQLVVRLVEAAPEESHAPLQTADQIQLCRAQKKGYELELAPLISLLIPLLALLLGLHG